ncbi:TRAP transporter small permease [Vibrio scophthalmi]|uniref:TRAP transporter small permease protein n=1 Tax=Vibrio ichthyoenteri ATCC 700023 TaxID=870968 RepID=F9S7E8_9VIBR|nr:MULTISPECIES: TRAP transporter small permease [Vibrio]EGU31428.1 tripartite ATP-independent periplasmic transporter DctQ [Vibrio ichthyoenteri ATCC 700023]EGU34374.1 tripartite ATP-independent periplasmic transporter DctQ [Vibrio sp. N418]
METQVSLNQLEDKPKNKIIATLDRISELDTFIAASFLAIIVLLMSYGVVTRYVFNSPSSWVEEVCLALFVWMTFMGSSALMRTDEVVRIDFLVHKIPAKAANVLDNLCRPLLVIFALAFMVYWGWKLLPFSQVRFTPALKLPYVYIYAAVPVSGMFMLYHQLKHLYSFFVPCNKEA